jgi:hypothetical protein
MHFIFSISIYLERVGFGPDSPMPILGLLQGQGKLESTPVSVSLTQGSYPWSLEDRGCSRR